MRKDYNQALKYYSMDRMTVEKIYEGMKEPSLKIHILQASYNIALCYRAMKDFQKSNRLIKDILDQISGITSNEISENSEDYKKLKSLCEKALY